MYIYVYIYTVLANPTYDCFPVTFLTQGCWPTPEVLCSRSYMPLPPGTRGGCAACSLFLFTSDVSLLQSEGLTHSAFCSVGKFQLGSFPGATCQTCVSLGCVIQRVGRNRIYTPHITWFSCQYTVHSTCIYIYGHRIWSPYIYIYGSGHVFCGDATCNETLPKRVTRQMPLLYFVRCINPRNMQHCFTIFLSCPPNSRAIRACSYPYRLGCPSFLHFPACFSGAPFP